MLCRPMIRCAFIEIMTLDVIFTVVSQCYPYPPLPTFGVTGWPGFPRVGIFLLPLKVGIRNGHNNLRPWKNKA